MKIILDANVVISGLLGSRATATILTSQNHLFFAPVKIIEEIKKYKKEICEKSSKTNEEFEINYNALMEFINILDFVDYANFMDKAKEVLRKRDIKDADYLACGLAVNANFIWSNDKDFQIIQNIFSVKTTDQFIKDGKLN